jgi:hypothetical protein
MSSILSVSGDEKVVRILHRDWVIDGKIQINAFALRQNETYISVNRPAIESYVNDVSDFVTNHKAYCVSDDSQSVRLAGLNVGDIRTIDGIVIISPMQESLQDWRGQILRVVNK